MAKKKILVVTGDPVLRRFLRHSLSERDYRVTSAEDDGVDLRGVLDREPPDLAIVDVMMPRLDGIKTCLLIRQWSQVPIIMFSTWGAGKDRVRGLDLSADEYLTESFGIEELMAWIVKALRHNRTSENISSDIGQGVP